MDRGAFMRRAAELALRGRGFTAPNPCVGAVLVRGGEIMAEGWHKALGGPHAEREAIADVRARDVDPSECEMYVTLEPCNHHGKTPPCTEAVLEAGIRRVFVGTADPNPDVAGGGVNFLREHGVAVEIGLEEELCRDLIADFLVWKQTDRPYTILKMAQTLDGRIAAPSGRPEAVSGPESRCRVHGLRARVDAVIVGGGTFQADNPSLTCRDAHLARDKQPLAVVVTSRLPHAGGQFVLLSERAEETIFLTDETSAASESADMLRDLGCRVWGLPRRAEGLDLTEGMVRLRRETGCLYTLVEGGGHLAMSVTMAGLADETWLFVAPRILGDERAPGVFSGRRVDSLAETYDLRIMRTERSGEDLLVVLAHKREM